MNCNGCDYHKMGDDGKCFCINKKAEAYKCHWTLCKNTDYACQFRSIHSMSDVLMQYYSPHFVKEMMGRRIKEKL